MIIISKKTIYYILIFLILLLALRLGLNIFLKTKEVINMEPYYQGDKDEDIISIACNIDWGNEYIDDILRILKEKDVLINFFPTGRWASENKEILKNIHKNQHEVGSHGFQHLDYDKLNYNSNYEEIRKAHETITSIIGEEIEFFAPPSGAFNKYTLEAAKEFNYKTILWSIDTIDWRQYSTSSIIFDRVKEKLHKSGIILIHPTEETVKALGDIINYIESKGYRIVKLSELL